MRSCAFKYFEYKLHLLSKRYVSQCLKKEFRIKRNRNLDVNCRVFTQPKKLSVLKIIRFPSIFYWFNFQENNFNSVRSFWTSWNKNKFCSSSGNNLNSNLINSYPFENLDSFTFVNVSKFRITMPKPLK